MRRLLLPPVLALACAALAGCATNPATGRAQIALLDEREELALGRAEDRDVLADTALYGPPALQEYVQRLGMKLAARTERPHLPWTFRVVDDPAVNAFALPGGFVYVTRGILTHLTSEAQLATVLGHEIGHVTARHGVSQLAKARIAGVGLGVAAILAGGGAAAEDLAATGTRLLVLRFSRHDEAQADELAVRYAVAAGYDPRPMADVFALLAKVSAQEAGGGRLPTWLASHPAPDDRRGRIARRIRALGADFAAAERAGDAYLRRLDGLVFAENPRAGYRRGRRFVHPDLRFAITLPEGWDARNDHPGLTATAPDGSASITLGVAPQPSAAQASRAFLDEPGIGAAGEWRPAIHGLTTIAREFTSRRDGEELEGLVAFVELGGRTFRLLATTPRGLLPRWRASLEACLASFAPLTDPAALAAEPLRLAIVALPRAMTLEDFALAYPSSVPIETLALINQVEPGRPAPAGTLWKRVTGGVPPG